MTTIKDIAKISGYSISTVSRVLNNRADVSEKAREKIEKVIRELNYQPNENARMLKQTVSSDISVIVRGNKSIFLESILEEIQIRMGKHGESVNVQFIGETDDEVATAVQIGQYLKPKGFIFLGAAPIISGRASLRFPCQAFLLPSMRKSWALKTCPASPRTTRRRPAMRLADFCPRDTGGSGSWAAAGAMMNASSRATTAP